MMLFEAYKKIDAQLVAAGAPPTSEWWLSVLASFYAHPTARRFVGRVGRGGSKSMVMVRSSIVEMLAGEFKIPAGERHYVVHVSDRLDEARQRIAQVASYFDMLGVRHERRDDRIELADGPLGFWCLPSSVSGVKGVRAIRTNADECATWSVDGANPAEDVIASLDAMAITHPDARSMIVSSPMSTLDYHAKLFEEGDSEHQLVRHAESWTANPDAITRNQAWRASKGNKRVFDREYAAIPQASRLAAFDDDAIDRAFGRQLPERMRGQRVIVLDPSSGRKDAWTWAVVGFTRCGGVDHVEVDQIDAQEGRFFLQVSADKIAERIAELAHREKIRMVIADQREALALSSVFSKQGLSYVSIPWTNPAKIGAVESVRRWLRENTLVLPEHEKTRRELRAFEERVTPSGALTFAGRGEHDDYVALLLTAAMAIEQGYLSPGNYAGESAATVFNESRFADPAGDLAAGGDFWSALGSRGF